MNISFRCNSCGKSLAAPPTMAGKRVKCRQCGTVLQIPTALTDEDAGEYGFAQPLPIEPLRRPSIEPEFKRTTRKKPKAKSRKNSTQETSRFAWVGSTLGITLVVVMFFLRTLPKISRIGQGGRGIGIAATSSNGDEVPTGPIALPQFPDLGPGREIEPGILFYDIALGPKPAPTNAPPGHSGRLWLYLPKENAPEKPLPCVFIAPAGTTLLTGSDLGDFDGDVPEHLPWVRAGFAVVCYDLDGPVSEQPTNAAFTAAMTTFLKARGGVTNAHIALEFVLAKVPQVDPQQLFAVGHSSAGTVALLFAEHEPRLKACVAFAPAIDVVDRIQSQAPQIGQSGETIALLRKISPKTYEDRLKCPVFLFHAADDQNVPINGSVLFQRQMQARGLPVTLEQVPSGGHYDPMIQQGIPRAIEWVKGLSNPNFDKG